MSDQTVNQFLSQADDAAARTGFVPDPPSPASDLPNGYLCYQRDTQALWAWDSDAAAWVNVVAGVTPSFDRLAVGAGADLDQYTAVYAGSTAYFVGNFQTEITDFTKDYVVGLNGAFSLNPAGAVTIPCYAIAGILWTDAADSNNFLNMLGVYGEAAHYGSGDMSGGVRGVDAWAMNSGSGTVGTVATPNSGCAAFFAEGWGVDGTGDALYAQGLYIKAPTAAGAGIAEADAIRIEDVDVANITTKRVFRYAGTGTFTIDKDSNIAMTAYQDLTEISAPAAPAANTGRLYVVDNGAGKSQLAVRFASGAVQVIATEP